MSADDRLTGYATANVTPVTPEDTARLLELGEAVREALRPCPIRDCEGHEGAHFHEYSPTPETWT